jgi:hypothetical protein
MTRTVILDTTSVILRGGPAGSDVLVYGPGTFDSDSVYVSGVKYSGLVYVGGTVDGSGPSVSQLSVFHPHQLAILPFGMFFAAVLALLTVRFRL